MCIRDRYYNDDLSLSEIGENFGITRQGARDAIKHGAVSYTHLDVYKRQSYTYIVQGLVIIVAVAIDIRKYLAKK